VIDAIPTARLRLEPLQPEHAGALFAGLQEPAIYEFLAEAPPSSLAWLEGRYRCLATRVSPDGRDLWLNWAVWSNEASEYLGYVQATVHRDQTAEIAYVLFPSAWGRGHATEAVAAMIEDLRKRLVVTTFIARVHPRNRRSARLLDRLGFLRVGSGGVGEEARAEGASDDLYRL
jgi:RimJ/RimL family protein N-acetyltransferase